MSRGRDDPSRLKGDHDPALHSRMQAARIAVGSGFAKVNEKLSSVSSALEWNKRTRAASPGPWSANKVRSLAPRSESGCGRRSAPASNKRSKHRRKHRRSASVSCSGSAACRAVRERRFRRGQQSHCVAVRKRRAAGLALYGCSLDGQADAAMFGLDSSSSSKHKMACT
jgi:hypothetical protein